MENKQKSSILLVFKFVIPFVRHYFGWVGLDMICMMFSTLLNVANAFLLGKVIDSALKTDYRELWIYLIVLTILTLFNIVTAFMTRFAYANYGSKATRDLQNHITQKVTRLTGSYIENHHLGDITSRMTGDVSEVQGFLDGGFSLMLFHPVMLTGICIVMFLVDWKMLLLCMAVIPFSMFISSRVTKPINKQSKDIREQMGKVNSLVLDAIGGINIIKAFNLVEPMYIRFRQMLESKQNYSLKLIKTRSFISPIGNLVGIIPTVTCVFYGGYLSITGEITPGGIMTSLRLIGFATWSAASIPQSIVSLRQLSGSIERILELINEPDEPSGTCVENLKADAVPIVFDKVCFSYDGKLKVLDEMSFTVPKGRTVALVGPSGTGKTTVIKLLCNFYLSQRGTINLYARDIREWNTAVVRSMISLVSQDTYLYPTTIEENIAYGCPDAKLEDIENAARAADAHEFIMGFKDGYQTVVGERGIRLSGGQKQRIAIARAFLKDAPIILLDEPTSALDNESEAHVQLALENLSKGKTVFVIAHRLSTIKNADIVLVMNEGRVIEQGTHDMLIERDGLYKQLYLKQFAAEEFSGVCIEEGA